MCQRSIADDVNWDCVGFYKWECDQRKLSCGDGLVQVVLTEASIGQDARRVHLQHNVAYDTATLGIRGLGSGQLVCKELFMNHSDPAIRLAFIELVQMMDEKFPKTPEKKKQGRNWRAEDAGRVMPLALLGTPAGAPAATSSSALPALEDVDSGEMAADNEGVDSGAAELYSDPR